MNSDCVEEVCGVKRGYTNTIECVVERKPACDVNRLLSHPWEGQKEHMTVLLGVWSEYIIGPRVASMCRVCPCVPNLGLTQQYFAFDVLI